MAEFSKRHHESSANSGIHDNPPPPSILDKYPPAWVQAAGDAYMPGRDDPSPNYTDKNPQKHVTGLDGNACKAEIPDGKAPTLTSGRKPKSCDFKDITNREDQKIDMPGIYDQAQKSTMHLEMHGRIGNAPITATASGVAVGKDSNKCFVVTDNHAVGGADDARMNLIYASIDNKSFGAHTIWQDPANDRALLAVDMGKHPELCQPAKIADKPDVNGRAVGAGYPESSNALTLSPMRLHGRAPIDEAVGPSDPKAHLKENPHRTVVLSDGNTLEGQSGGGIWDKNKEFDGLVGGGFPGVHDFTYVNTLDRKQIEEAIAKHGKD